MNHEDECLEYLKSRGVRVPHGLKIEFHKRRAWVEDRSAPIENAAAVIRLVNLASFLAGKCQLRGQYRRGDVVMKYVGVEQFEAAERLHMNNVFGDLRTVDILPDGIRGKIVGREASFDDAYGCKQVFASERVAYRLESN